MLGIQNYVKIEKKSASLNREEYYKMASLWNEASPTGLQRKFYLIVAARCLIKHFKEEMDIYGNKISGELFYLSIITIKIVQPLIRLLIQKGSSTTQFLAKLRKVVRTCAMASALSRIKKDEFRPVRLFISLLDKRTPKITTNRLFLTPNPAWHGLKIFLSEETNCQNRRKTLPKNLV